MLPTSATAYGSTADTQSTRAQFEQVLSLIITTILTAFVGNLLRQEWFAVKYWRPLPWARQLILLIYLSAFLFVFASWTVQIVFEAGINMSAMGCSMAGTLCLGAYVGTKLVYLFIVEKAHIIRGATKARHRSKLYTCNTILMLGTYGFITMFNFHFRASYYDSASDTCVIGLERAILIPIVVFDALVNVYLTSLFLIPLLKLHSIQASILRPWTMGSNHRHPRTPQNVRLRRLALRTFLGALLTLTVSLTNLSVLVALGGEVVWLCLACCNTDILITAFLIRWTNTSPKKIAKETPNVEAQPMPDLTPELKDS
ncbi:hypothetical protein CGCVW01_v008568 [Colletotrichum viniferum]|nr:hypothetical protein CGCVW01_v008568 [Colletotrichum viniferum]